MAGLGLALNDRRRRIRGAGGATIATTPSTTAVSADGSTTWTFSTSVPVGYYPNGDPFVIATPGATITGITPAYALDAGGTWLFNSSEANTTQAVTFQDTGDTVTRTGHGLVNGQKVRFPTVVTTTGITANTDYFVVSAAANTFQVAATPGGVALPLTNNGTGTMQRYGVSTRARNGAMLNPGNSATIYGGTGSVSTNNGGATPDTLFLQSFDSIDSVDAVNGSTIQNYSAALNVDPGLTSLPISIASPVSVVKAISNTAAVTLEGRQNIDRLNVLTVVASAPLVGSFRPAPAATSKVAPALASQINLSFLPNLSRTGVTGAPANLTATIALFINLYQSGFTNNLFTRSIAPRLQQGGVSYGRDIASNVSDALQLLCLDYPASEKLALATVIIQIGLDFYERTVEGGAWPGGTTSAGGGNHHYQMFVVFAALALAGSPIGAALAAVAGGTKFAMTRQMFEITQNDVDTPRTVQTPQGAPFLPPMKGAPEWQSKWRSVGTPGDAFGAGSAIFTKYRANVTSTSFGAFTAFMLMTGGQAMVNEPLFFDYYYRHKNWIPAIEFETNDTVTPLTLYFSNNFLPAYNNAVPARTGIFGQGRWVWAKFDRLLDVANPPLPGDFVVKKNGGGAEPITTIGPLTTNGATAPSSIGAVQTMVMNSVTGVVVGHRVIHPSLPADTFVTAINGLTLSLSRRATATIASGQNITFSPVMVYGYSAAVLLDNALAQGDTFTMAYTSGATPVRSIANTNVASFGDTAGTNETSLYPPPALSKFMVGNDNAAPVKGHVAGAAAPVDATVYTHLLVGIRLRPLVNPVAGENHFTNAAPSTSSMRLYSATTTATRVLIFGGSIRPVNNFTSADTGVSSTHWFRIDFSNYSLATYKMSKNGVAVTQSGSALWTLPSAAARTFLLSDLFPTAVAAWGPSNGLADIFQGAIQEIFLHANTAAQGPLPDPEANAVLFGNSQDWGGNGENILGFPPLGYWAFNQDDANAGTTINRGTGGQTLALYNTPDIDLELVQPFRNL